MPQANLTNDIVTIDSVLNEFKQWRKNKGTSLCHHSCHFP